MSALTINPRTKLERARMAAQNLAERAATHALKCWPSHNHEPHPHQIQMEARKAASA